MSFPGAVAMGAYSCEVCGQAFAPLAENQKVCGRECRLEVNRRRDRERYEQNREKKLAMVHEYRRGESRERYLAVARELNRKRRAKARETAPGFQPRNCAECGVVFQPTMGLLDRYCSDECARVVRRRENAAKQSARYHALNEEEKQEYHQKTMARHRERMKDPAYRELFRAREKERRATPEYQEKMLFLSARWYAKKCSDPEFMRRLAERSRKYRLRRASRAAAKQLLNDLGPKLKELLHVSQESSRRPLCPDRC